MTIVPNSRVQAADAVEFSDEAVWSAAKALFEKRTGNSWKNVRPEIRNLWRAEVMTVIAALNGAGYE